MIEPNRNAQSRSEHDSYVPGLVSTIIPVFNRAERVRDAVQSVLDQTYPLIEVILVDDGSTDDTPQMLERLAQASPGLVKVITQSNAGPGVARQNGVENSRGEFVQFLDSDDIYLGNKTKCLIDVLLSNPSADIGYGRMQRRGADGVVKADEAHREGEKHSSLFPTILAGRIWHANVPLYRASSLKRIGPWPAKRNLEDWEFDAQAGAVGVRLVYVDEVLAEQRAHHGGHLGQAWRRDIGLHRQRLDALNRIWDLAAGDVKNLESDEFRGFLRTYFFEARTAFVAGLTDEASAMLNRLAHEKGTTARQARTFLALARVGGTRLTVSAIRFLGK